MTDIKIVKTFQVTIGENSFLMTAYELKKLRNQINEIINDQAKYDPNIVPGKTQERSIIKNPFVPDMPLSPMSPAFVPGTAAPYDFPQNPWYKTVD